MASGQGTMLASYGGKYPLLPSPANLLLLGLAFPPGHLPEGWLQTYYHLHHSFWQPSTQNQWPWIETLDTVILYGCKSPGKKQYKLLDLMWPPPYHTARESIYMPPMGFLYKRGDASNQGERQPLTSKNHQALQFKEWLWLHYSSHC